MLRNLCIVSFVAVFISGNLTLIPATLCFNVSLFYTVTSERRHSSPSKQASTLPFPVLGRNRSSGLGPGLGLGTVAGLTAGSTLVRSSTAGSSLSSSTSSSNQKPVKSAKEKQPNFQRRTPFAPFRILQPDKM